MQGPLTLTLRLRTNPIFWPAIALWAFVPGFGWLGQILTKMETT